MFQINRKTEFSKKEVINFINNMFPIINKKDLIFRMPCYYHGIIDIKLDFVDDVILLTSEAKNKHVELTQNEYEMLCNDFISYLYVFYDKLYSTSEWILDEYNKFSSKLMEYDITYKGLKKTLNMKCHFTYENNSNVGDRLVVPN